MLLHNELRLTTLLVNYFLKWPGGLEGGLKVNRRQRQGAGLVAEVADRARRN